MEDYWQKQVVLVTGGSGGIGREMVRHLVRLGCKVAINYVQRTDAAKQLVDELETDRARIYRADIGDDKQVDEMVTRIEEELGEVTILVNNAGIIRNNLLITMTNEDWHSVINTHLNGTFYCTRRVLKNMLKARFGRIINVSSISGVEGNAGQVHYASAKAGVIAFAKSLAQEVGSKGITCNALVLNLFKTENALKNVKPEIFKRIEDNSPLKRVGDPHEVVHAIEYMAGPHSGLMTGQVVTL
jgi:3-oxoacyl-[acyl-carrier protein] reductase